MSADDFLVHLGNRLMIKLTSENKAVDMKVAVQRGDGYTDVCMFKKPRLKYWLFSRTLWFWRTVGFMLSFIV